MIAVLGATGNIGAPLVAQLAREGHKVRVTTRDAKKQFPAGVEAVAGNLDAEHVERVLDGADRLFLLVPPTAGLQLESQVIAAAKGSGVKHVVKVSTIGAASEPPQGFGVHHREREKELEASGLQWTMLRPGFFMSNVLIWVGEARASGAIRYNTGDGVFYPIAPQDIAAVAALALTTDGHVGKHYALTGDEPITAAQQIEAMGRVWGKKVEAVANTLEEAAEALRKRGSPEPAVKALVALWEATRAGRGAFHTDTVKTLLGRPAIAFGAWAKEHLPAL